MEMCPGLSRMVRKGLIEMKIFPHRLKITTKEPCIYLGKSVTGRGSDQCRDSKVEMCLDVKATGKKPEWLETNE